MKNMLLRLALAILAVLATFFSAPLQGQNYAEFTVVDETIVDLAEKPAYVPEPAKNQKSTVGRGYLVANQPVHLSMTTPGEGVGYIFVTRTRATGEVWQKNKSDGRCNFSLEKGDTVRWDIYTLGGEKSPKLLQIQVGNGNNKGGESLGGVYEILYFDLLPVSQPPKPKETPAPQSYTFKSLFGRSPLAHPGDTIRIAKKPTQLVGERYWISEPVFRTPPPATYSAPSRQLYADELEKYVRKTIASSGPQAWWSAETRQVTVDAGNQPGVYVILDDQGEEKMRLKLTENEQITVRAPFSGELGGISRIESVTVCMGCPTPPAPER